VPFLLAASIAACTGLWKLCVPNVGSGEYIRALSFGGIVLYSAVITKLLNNLSSVEVGAPDNPLAPVKHYLRRDTGYEYMEPSHVPIVVGSLIYSIFYGLFLPAFLLYLWWQTSRKLKGTLRSYHFGFLVKGYQREYFWWEYTVLCRRFLCCLVVAVSSRDPFLTASIIAVIFIMSIHFHLI
jgi:hypothetical protein